jgi:transcription antitermination protein NusB
MGRKFLREINLQILYSAVFKNDVKNTLNDKEILTDFYSENKLNDEDISYCESTISTIVLHYDELIEIIKKYLKNWTIEQVYKVDLTILLLSISELKYSTEKLSPSIIINEAVELAKKYSKEKSYSFVNGVLANFVKEESN